jgi:hypothetical protein
MYEVMIVAAIAVVVVAVVVVYQQSHDSLPHRILSVIQSRFSNNTT